MIVNGANGILCEYFFLPVNFIRINESIARIFAQSFSDQHKIPDQGNKNQADREDHFGG